MNWLATGGETKEHFCLIFYTYNMCLIIIIIQNFQKWILPSSLYIWSRVHNICTTITNIQVPNSFLIFSCTENCTYMSTYMRHLVNLLIYGKANAILLSMKMLLTIWLYLLRNHLFILIKCIPLTWQNKLQLILYSDFG